MNAIIERAHTCCSGGMAFEAAYARILGLAGAPLPADLVALTDCVGRVAATTIRAVFNLPRFDQAAMDGYAVHCDNVTPGGRLPVIGRTAAGDVPATLVPGTVHRILTGAPVPAGADAVVAQEDVVHDGDDIQLVSRPSPGTNIRTRGEDMQSGCVLVQPGTRLDWRHVTVLAAHGIKHVAVRRRPRVAILSSGNELRMPGETLSAGQIHDSNGPMLSALLSAWGAQIVPTPLVPDNASAVRSAIAEAASQTDLIVTSAGISVGDEDHVRAALGDLGSDFAVLKVAMKPGKPLAAGRLGESVFVGLPGNPMAALAGAVAFVRPLLARLIGCPITPPLRAVAAFDLTRKPGRTEFVPVRLRQDGTSMRAERTGPDGSGRLSPLLAATGFAILDATQESVERGSVVPVLPFLPNEVLGRV